MSYLYRAPVFKMAVMAAPDLAAMLRKRYRNLKRDVVPALSEHICRKFGPDTKIDFVSLIGSTTCFIHYADIDLQIGLSTGHEGSDNMRLKFRNEHNETVSIPAEIFYCDPGKDSAADYFRYYYKTVILAGELPSLFPESTAEMLLAQIPKAFKVYEGIVAENDIRKAMHRLFGICRTFYNLYTHIKKPLPDDFVPVLRSLYAMDKQDRYYLPKLTSIRQAMETSWMFR